MQINYQLKVTGSLVLAMVLGGCSRHEPVPPPIAKRNIDATEKYALVLTIEEPGYVDGIEARAAYSIANERDCAPKDHSQALGGRWNHSTETLDLAVTRIEVDKFRAETFKHPFLDEDYYAMGTCKWSLSTVTFFFGSQSVTTTISDIENNEIRSALCLRRPTFSGSQCSDQDAVDPKIRSLYFPVIIETHKE